MYIFSMTRQVQYFELYGRDCLVIYSLYYALECFVGCESLVIRREEEKYPESFEMWWWRRMEGIK